MLTGDKTPTKEGCADLNVSRGKGTPVVSKMVVVRRKFGRVETVNGKAKLEDGVEEWCEDCLGSSC